ncbi:MAG: hypothetical protein M3R72_10975, partial [Bacteroidota bacterium]|nr:hypothetical protein [Bacteroidota bacterium]
MKNISFVLLFLFVGFTVSAQTKTDSSTRLTLPNGWSLSPAGRGYLLGDLPLNIAVSNSKKLMAVTN